MSLGLSFFRVHDLQDTSPKPSWAVPDKIILSFFFFFSFIQIILAFSSLTSWHRLVLKIPGPHSWLVTAISQIPSKILLRTAHHPKDLRGDLLVKILPRLLAQHHQRFLPLWFLLPLVLLQFLLPVLLPK